MSFIATLDFYSRERLSGLVFPGGALDELNVLEIFLSVIYEFSE
jgi:hypothetical protein